MKHYKMWIDGEWVDAESRKTRTIINPANGEVLAEVPEGDVSDAKRAIKAAQQAFDEGPWQRFSGSERSKIMFHIADLIRDHATKLAEIETLNTGKTIAQATADVLDSANHFENYGSLAADLDRELLISTPELISFVVREPIGVVTLITPWNFPMLISTGKLAPVLAAGDTCVLKPSELTPLSVLELGKLLKQTDLPRGVVNIVTGAGPTVGAALTESMQVDHVTFTGGTVTGRKIMQAATSNFKKVTLELGGKSPNIVFSDANLEVALDYAARAIFLNQGQVCCAGSRLIIQDSIHDEFVEKLVEKARKIKLGPGIDPETEMGPLITQTHREKVERYVRLGIDEGAKLLTGGNRPQGEQFENGFFLEPTIFDQVNNKMRIAQEEIFGPVLCVIPFSSEEQAVQIANDTIYGLVGAVWTGNIQKGMRVLSQLKVGTGWLNTYFETCGNSPWGGYKQSGIGREGGKYGLEEYMEVKQVNINLTH